MAYFDHSTRTSEFQGGSPLDTTPTGWSTGFQTPLGLRLAHALPHRFVHQNGRTNRHIETVHPLVHRYS